MGDEAVHEALEALPEVVKAHVIAGPAALLVKVRTATTGELQVESFFERPVDTGA